jgi:hypothetical protein
MGASCEADPLHEFSAANDCGRIRRGDEASWFWCVSSPHRRYDRPMSRSVDRNKTLAKILRERDAEIARRAPRYPGIINEP